MSNAVQCRRWLRILAMSATLAWAALLGAASTVAIAADPPPPPSAIGDRPVFWIAVSPAYNTTGLVAAIASASDGCPGGQKSCSGLWISHDGGASWSRTAAQGWDGSRLEITLDAAGREVMFSQGSTLERSDDGGATWTSVGASGLPAIAPSYPADGMLAVANATNGDYVVRNGVQHPVAGSSKPDADIDFMLAPSFPDGGKYSPALVSAEDTTTNTLLVQKCTADLVCSGVAPLAGAPVMAVPIHLHPAGDYASSGVVFAQTGRGIYRSADGGGSFALIPMGDPKATATATPMLALAPGFSANGAVRTAYAAVFQIINDQTHPKQSGSEGGVYRTTDAGVTWQKMGSPGPVDGGVISVAVAPDGRLFAGYLTGFAGQSGTQRPHNGLVCSADGGSTWRASCPGVGIHASDAHNGGAQGAGGNGANGQGGCAGKGCAGAQDAHGGSQGAGAGAGGAGGVQGVATGAQAGSSGVLGAHPAVSAVAFAVAAVLLAGLAVTSGASRRLRRRRRLSPDET